MLLLTMTLLAPHATHDTAPHLGLNSSWVPIGLNGSHATNAVTPDSALFSFATSVAVPLSAINTGPLVDSAMDAEGSAALGGVRELRFRLRDGAAGTKTRLEATTCFSTNASLRHHGIDPGSKEVHQLEALSLISLNCSSTYASKPYPVGPGAAAGGVTNVSYSLRLPRDLSPSATAIMGQFHGRPDSRLFLDPATNATQRLSTSEAYAACGYATLQQRSLGKRGCKDGVVRGGARDGWRYKQGGYPPLTWV